MGRTRHTAEQIIGKLREPEVALAKGQTTGEVARKLGITEQTDYRWRKEYGSLRVDQSKRLNAPTSPSTLNRGAHSLGGGAGAPSVSRSLRASRQRGSSHASKISMRRSL